MLILFLDLFAYVALHVLVATRDLREFLAAQLTAVRLDLFVRLHVTPDFIRLKK